MASTFDKLMNRSFEEWAVGSVATYGATKLGKTQWRRGIRNFGAAGMGGGRHLRATYKTMGDFHRANKLGNQPFSVEPHIPGIIATSLYVATPVAMFAVADMYPSIAGPAQSTAVTGQIGIGSPAGQRLISGKLF